MKLLIRQGEDGRGGGGMAQFNGGGRRVEAEGRRPCPTTATEEDPDSQLQCKQRGRRDLIRTIRNSRCSSDQSDKANQIKLLINVRNF